MSDNPELLDYVVFFEAEPEWVHPDGWHHGARFTTLRGEDRVIATVAPDEGEFALEWWQGGRLRLRLRLAQVGRWAIKTGGARECLRLGFMTECMEVFELQLKPHVQVEWGLAWA